MSTKGDEHSSCFIEITHHSPPTDKYSQWPGKPLNTLPSTEALLSIPLTVYLAVWHDGWVGGCLRLEACTPAWLLINYMTSGG